MLRKQPKSYWLSKHVSRTYTFKGLEKVLDDINVNTRMEEIIKSLLRFVARVNNFQPLSQMLEEIVNDDSEIKIIINKQVKIQYKTSIAYINIMKKKSKIRIKNSTHIN